MKKLAWTFLLFIFSITSVKSEEKNYLMTEKTKQSAPMKAIQLNPPDLNRGKAIMQAFSDRQSIKSCLSKELSIQDLSDLLWAANGINRPGSGKRTAPSAMNKQDVKVYVCTEKGNYLYEPQKSMLEPLSESDVRPAEAPVVLVLVTDTNDTWAALDAGIVSENISLFCAGTGMATYPRATMDKNLLKKALKLNDSQTFMLCHPVGYMKGK